MALSSYSNWGTLQNYSEITPFQQRQAQLARDLDLLGYSNNLDVPNTIIEPCYDPESLLYPDDYIHLLPYFSSPYDPLISLSPEIFPCEEFDPCSPYPKRQKCNDQLDYSGLMPNSLDGFVPEFLPEFKIPQVNCNGNNVENVKKVDERSFSAQSIAARERRRKITEKTQEVGELIPGGHKMNTAEMLQAAFKYAKYLQAQVGILEFMNSVQSLLYTKKKGGITDTSRGIKPTQENEGAAHIEELAVLASPTVQEKLFLDDKCLVPIEFVKTLTKRHDINSNPSISNDLNRLISSVGKICMY